MYCTRNFKTKKELKAAVELWNKAATGNRIGVVHEVEPVTLFAPGIGEPNQNGREFVEGPHYPKPHTWYAQVTVKDGIVVAVK